MKILVTFAVDSEFGPWRRLRAFRRTFLGAVSVFEARVGKADVCAVCTAIGPGHAARMMPRLLVEPPDVCISSGLAGGLRRDLRPGAILVARSVRRVESSAFIKSDAALVRRASECGARIVDSFLTSSSVVLTAEQKSRLGAFGDAVEMESYEVLKGAAALGIPAVAVRAVSDPVEVDLPLDFNRIVSGEGRVDARRLAAQVAARLDRLPALVRLGRETSRAATALARFLDDFIQALEANEAQESSHSVQAYSQCRSAVQE